MSFPLPTNATCDIYRDGTGPPTPPAAVGVGMALYPRFRNIKPQVPAPSDAYYTHVAYVPLGTDIRDGWPGAGGNDMIYVPSYGDPNYQDYTVVFVERVWFGGDRGKDHKAVYLMMNDQPPWESDNC